MLNTSMYIINITMLLLLYWPHGIYKNVKIYNHRDSRCKRNERIN